MNPDWQRGYKQAWHDSSAQDSRTEFLSEVADFPSQVVDAEKAMEPIPSQTADVSCADVSCATEEQDDVVMVKAWVSTLKRKNQPFYTTSDAAAPPLGVFAEMGSHLAITDHRVDSLLLPDLPEPDPPNTPPVGQQPTSGPLSGFNLPPQAQPPPVVQPLPLGSQSLHQPVTHLLGPPPWETLMFSLPGVPQPLHNLPGQCIQLILSSCDQQAPLRRSPSCRDTLNHHCSAAPLPDAAPPPAANDSQHNGTMDEGVIDRLKVTHIVNEVKRLLIRYAFDPRGSVSQNFAWDRKKIEAYVQWVLKQVKIKTF